MLTGSQVNYRLLCFIGSKGKGAGLEREFRDEFNETRMESGGWGEGAELNRDISIVERENSRAWNCND